MCILWCCQTLKRNMSTFWKFFFKSTWMVVHLWKLIEMHKNIQNTNLCRVPAFQMEKQNFRIFLCRLCSLRRKNEYYNLNTISVLWSMQIESNHACNIFGVVTAWSNQSHYREAPQCSGRFLWNRNWDLDWIWAEWPTFLPSQLQNLLTYETTIYLKIVSDNCGTFWCIKNI